MKMNTEQLRSLIIEVVKSIKPPLEKFSRHLLPSFRNGQITLYPGATQYAIGYGELHAFRDEEIIATWSVDVPDMPEEYSPKMDLSGEWIPRPRQLWAQEK